MLAATQNLRCGPRNALVPSRIRLDDADAAPRALSAGDLIDRRYRAEELLGEGGMGVVVAAHDVLLDRRVALKCLRSELCAYRDVVERFWWEARLTSQLPGEHFVRVTDAGRLPNGAPYFAMELLEGTDLGALLKRRGGRLAPDEAVGCVIQACEALALVHGSGVVHRDLKPTNLFLARHSGAAAVVKVIDFGLASGPGAPISAAPSPAATDVALGQCLGSPPYMSPEQVLGFDAVDSRADVWSLGAVLYELLTGQLVHRAPSLEVLLARICHAPVPSVRTHQPAISPELDTIVLGCLERDPRHRIQSANDLARRLRQISLA